ncbi:MATE family efflux transporter [Dyadobacter bucti]|uniref:MATE family efflux transporter n=1 Tax=Dyadobacter bucti TaxID=2572203 RepID=UPI001108C74A|nr:MATE family efflux transporter [Dyadobacter bucti]
MQPPNKLGEAPISSLFFQYYIPALTSILSVTLHQVINGIILGQQVGKEGLAAVGLYGSVIIVFIALTLPVMIGGGILIGRNIGAGDYSEAQKIFNFATTLAILFGCMVALSTPFIVKPLAGFLAGANHEVLVRNTSDYMFWQFVGLPFFFLRMFWGNFVSNDGAPKVSRNASVLAVACNIVLDVLLIIVFPFGVAGASVATALSILISTAFIFLYIKKQKGHLSFGNFKFTLQLKTWKELANFGLPSFASEISFSSGLLIINHSIVSYGALAVSAFGLVNYISFIFIRLLTSAMIASLPIISFNIGAKLPGRVQEVLKFALTFTFVVGLLITAAGFAFPDLLVVLFSGEETAEFKKVAGGATSLYFLLFLAAGGNYILGAYFQSIGKAAISVLINVLKGIVLIAFFLMILPGYFNMGLNGIWLSRSLAEILTLLLIGCYTLFHKEKYFSKNAILSRQE